VPGQPCIFRLALQTARLESDEFDTTPGTRLGRSHSDEAQTPEEAEWRLRIIPPTASPGELRNLTVIEATS
jgi:hypothetical protein